VSPSLDPKGEGATIQMETYKAEEDTYVSG